MGTQHIAVTNRSGLQTAMDVVLAPKAAFAALREVPTWGWAFAIAAVLGIVASIVIGPAINHALSVELPARTAAMPQIAALPADQRDRIIAQQLGFAQTLARFSFVFIPIGLLFGALVQSVVMLIGNAIAHGQGTFKKFWAISMNVAVVGTGLASVVIAAIVLVRGADSFSTASEIGTSLPSLALLAPGASRAVTAYLGALNVFAIWGAVLLAAGMAIAARMPRGAAAATALVTLLLSGVFPLIGALAQR